MPAAAFPVSTALLTGPARVADTAASPVTCRRAGAAAAGRRAIHRGRGARMPAAALLVCGLLSLVVLGAGSPASADPGSPTPQPCQSGICVPTTPPPGTPPSVFPLPTPTRTSIADPCLFPSPGQGPPSDCTPTLPTPGTDPPTGGDDGRPGGMTGWIFDGITKAINAFFAGLVIAALNPLLNLVSRTLLTTPDPRSLPPIGALWNNSWQLLLASYAILVLIGGIVVMAYETTQTRYSIKEIAPRVVVGFLAATVSLPLTGMAVQVANTLVVAVMGGGADTTSVGVTVRNLVLNSLSGGIFNIFVGIVLAGVIVALLVTY